LGVLLGKLARGNGADGEKFKGRRDSEKERSERIPGLSHPNQMCFLAAAGGVSFLVDRRETAPCHEISDMR
jgi:hypothetical protein